jgi:hypothetical protein
MRRVPTRNDLANLLPKGGVGAELGVLDGLNAQALFKQSEPATMHLVDLWVGTMRPRRQIGGTWQEQIIEGPAALAAVQERFAAAIASRRIQLHRLDTVEWLSKQPASSLDWIYLDSCHDDFHVMRELHQSFRAVKAGGIIAGHDYDSVCPGVVAAVDRFCRQFSQTIAVLTDEEPQPIVNRLPWMPAAAPFNSFAIEVQK